MANIDLPLILVIASVVGVFIYIYDWILLRPQRLQRCNELKQAFPQWQLADSQDAKAYAAQLPDAIREPVIVRETKSFLPIILLVLVVRSFIVEPFQIPSSSMEPGLDVGDFILVNKFTYGLRLPVTNTKIIANKLPQRGEVMVFFPPNDPRYFIKRVIGLPGDKIDYKDKTLFINGEAQTLTAAEAEQMDMQGRLLFTEQFSTSEHEIYINPRWHDGGFYGYEVPEGYYFMMGDNRDNSSDSRAWGAVPEENIVGKAFFIWMHWKSWKTLPNFSSVGAIK